MQDFVAPNLYPTPNILQDKCRNNAVLYSLEVLLWCVRYQL